VLALGGVRMLALGGAPTGYAYGFVGIESSTLAIEVKLKAVTCSTCLHHAAQTRGVRPILAKRI